MIDLHCHLLPAIDDGPDTLEDSLELCRMAVDDGITHAIVTPHIHPGRWENSKQSIERDCRNLQSALNREDIPLKLGFAGEVRLTDQIIRQVENDEIPFYGEVDGYKIMLLEFPHGHIIPGSEKLVMWLLAQNIRPLIAHPERNKRVMKNPQVIVQYVEAGCFLQVTAGSIIGGFGEQARRVALDLLEGQLVSVIGSDAHNPKKRPPCLSHAYKKVASLWGEGRAQQLFFDGPVRIAGRQLFEKNSDRV